MNRDEKNERDERNTEKKEERKGMKKADNKQTKKDLQCQANLCGRDNWLKALGSVAIYLADRSAILTNDIFLLC